jgi:hypothetical protein
MPPTELNLRLDSDLLVDDADGLLSHKGGC